MYLYPRIRNRAACSYRSVWYGTLRVTRRTPSNVALRRGWLEHTALFLILGFISLILRYCLPCAVMCYHLNLHIFSPRSNMTPTRENAIKIRDSLAKHYVVKFSVKHDHLQWILWIQIISEGAILILIHLWFHEIFNISACQFFEG